MGRDAFLEVPVHFVSRNLSPVFGVNFPPGLAERRTKLIRDDAFVLYLDWGEAESNLSLKF